jgi:hypothetical protein
VAKELNDFLDVEGASDDAGPLAADAPQAPDSDDAASGAASAGVADGAKPKAPEEAAQVAPAPPDPEAVHEDIPEDIRGLRSALQAERGKRNDYKGERDRLTGELTAIKAALAAAEAKAAAPPVAPAVAEEPQAAPVVPNPLEDPQGYHAYTQRMLFNERLNLSEAMLRESPNTEKIDEKLAAFKKAMDANPALRSEFSRQAHPYRWAYDQGARQLAMAEVGDDPAAFRAKIEAEIRAKIEAEMSGAAPAQGAVASVILPRSLASATSSAPRMTAVEEAPEFADIFKPRKRG